MNHTKNPAKASTTYSCGCCKRELPADAFYLNARKQCPDRYCKECRKACSRKQHESEKRIQNENRSRNYLVITQIKDPEIKRDLILKALNTVRESIARKRKKEWEKEENDNA